MSDGTAYDFGSMVTESLTLYAKWTDDPAYTILKDIFQSDATWIIAVTVSVFVLAAGVIVSAIVLKKGRKHEKTGK